MVEASSIIGVLVVFLLVLLGLGLWGSRESDDMAGYYVAGKKLPSWVIAFSTNASGESAWLLLGLTGMGYTVGIHAFWVVLGEVLGVALGWILVARPFKEYTDRYDSITVPDYLADRFRDTGHVLRVISVLILFSMVIAYVAAQLTASGKAFNTFLDLSYTTGVLVGAAVILYYTTVGGFKAVAYTDLLQGVLMFVGLIVLPVAGFTAAGGWEPALQELRATSANLLRPLGEHGLSTTGLASVLSFAGIGLAFLGSPQLLVRFISARDQDEIVTGSLYSVLCIVTFDTGAVLTGMAGRVLYPGLGDPETVMPTMAAELFPAIITGIFLVIVLAAMMSTVDSLLLMASSAVVRDVVQKIFEPDVTERRLSFYGKVTSGILGLGGLLLALEEVRVIFWFVLFAWSGLASAFAPVVLCSLFWKGTTRAGAVAGMVGGFAATMSWVLYFKSGFYDLYEMWPGFLAGFALTIGVSLFTEPPDGSEREFRSVWRTVGRPFTGPEVDRGPSSGRAGARSSSPPRADGASAAPGTESEI